MFRARPRRGAVVVLMVLMMLMFMAFIAMSVDLGYIYTVRTELDRAVDASALAGAGALLVDPNGMQSTVLDYMSRNSVAGDVFSLNHVTIEAGSWDDQSRQFIASPNQPSAVRVLAARLDQRPLFFSPVLGRDHFEVRSEAVAAFQPRDIVLVLDYSGSMNDDSELRSIGNVGQAAVEANLADIYNELGAPSYGNLAFPPEWLTAVGSAPANSSQPQISVQYRYNQVMVTSTKTFYRVRIYWSGGSSISSSPGTWDSALNAYTTTVGTSAQITRVDVTSGYNGFPEISSNRYTETFSFDTAARIRQHANAWFALNSVPYPYPSGSWNDWIDYVRTSSYNSAAGYRYKFGYLNLVNYWLEKQPRFDQTPVLWQTSEQPITAVKDAVTVFLSYLQEVDTNDRLGLAVYNSPEGDSVLEQELTDDFGQIEQISRERQAGHYDSFTNIGAGLRAAIQELDDRARSNAKLMIVLMTDGIANRPSNETVGRQYALEQASIASIKQYPVVTISLGASADTDLMQQIADLTQGIHFNVPGGQSVEDYEDQLKDTFREIADDRPLKIVK